jgi:hypothetical protein
MEHTVKQHTELVKFNQTELVCPIINGEPHIVVKSIIDDCRLNYDSAVEGLKNNPRLSLYLAEWQGVTENMPGLNKGRKYYCLPVRKVAAWLYSVNLNKVNAEAKPMLTKYQEKCDDVLFNYFFGRRDSEQAYFDEKRELLTTKKALDAEIKKLRTVLQTLPEGRELHAKETDLKEIKMRLQRLEQKQFGMIYTLFDSSENSENEIEQGSI